jgi:small nuclear ribonucleoprotein D3
MNCLIENVVRTNRDGSKTAMEQVFIRGAQVRFFVVPDMLKHAPMFKNLLKQGQPAGAPPKGSGFGTLQPGKGKGGKGGKGGFRR